MAVKSEDKAYLDELRDWCMKLSIKFEDIAYLRRADALQLDEEGVVEDIGWRVCTTKDFFPTEPVAIYGGVVLDKDSVRAMEQKADNQGTLKSKTLQVESINKNGRKVKFFVDGTDEQSLMGSLINHRITDTNVRPLVVWSDDGEPMVIFIARRFIPKGTELQCSYHIEDKSDSVDFPWYY